MKSKFACPACAMELDWIKLSDGRYKLFCGSVNCNDTICGKGIAVETHFGEDVNVAMGRLTDRFERLSKIL